MIEGRAEQNPDLDVLTFEHLSLDGGATPDEVRTYADLHAQRQPDRRRAHWPRDGAWRSLRPDDAQPSRVRGEHDRGIDLGLRIRAHRPADTWREAGLHAAKRRLSRCGLQPTTASQRWRGPAEEVPEVGWVLGLETGEGPEAVPLESEAAVDSMREALATRVATRSSRVSRTGTIHCRSSTPRGPPVIRRVSCSRMSASVAHRCWG